MGEYLTRAAEAALLGHAHPPTVRQEIYWVLRDGHPEQRDRGWVTFGPLRSVDEPRTFTLEVGGDAPPPDAVYSFGPAGDPGISRVRDQPWMLFIDDLGLPRRAHTRPHRRSRLWHASSPRMWIGHQTRRRPAPRRRPRGRTG